jgi:hypothetical protein
LRRYLVDQGARERQHHRLALPGMTQEGRTND